MDRRAYTSANIIGALPWAVGLPVLGYFAYQVPVLRDIAYVVAGIAIAATVVTVLVGAARARRARRTAGPDSEASGGAQPDGQDDPAE
jgi:membrane protein DedA with SNARE-associated domain